jgi:hypothetical protein
VAILTGEYGARILTPLVAELGRDDVRVVAVRNEFFGGNTAVAGLLTCADLQRVLADAPAGHRYLLPDVSCDFTAVTLEQAGEHRVRVAGARGQPPGPAYKVSATYMDGFRCTAQLTVVGVDAAAKARRTARTLKCWAAKRATLARTRKPCRCARRCCSWR